MEASIVYVNRNIAVRIVGTAAIVAGNLPMANIE
jgi:hypothetical protein